MTMDRKNLVQAHPWHGISPGAGAPQVVNAFIELVPSDSVKFEVDKESGHLKLDRPQKYSNFCPAMYGFIPQTFCGEGVAACGNGTSLKGDGDPLDILVLTEKQISHGSILVRAIPIGGIRMIDKGEADDKIIAVLEGDSVYGAFRECDELPPPVLKRISHYFLTYKDMPGQTTENQVIIGSTYSRAIAHTVIAASIQDYAKL